MTVNVAVVGATGAVGEEFLRILESRKFPIRELRLLASKRSAGKKIRFCGVDYTVQELTKHSFQGIKIALFSAGSSISREFVPYAIESGAVCVDNSSAFRMDDDVPLVVPEVNPQDIRKHHGVIANPNCSTIQMVVALKPIHDVARIKRVVVSTYQAVSGAGLKAIDELEKESGSILAGKKDFKRTIFPHQIAFNVLPQIPQSSAFLPNGYTSEEMKMVLETKKIMGDDSIRVTATTVRVPVIRSHSESVNVETEKKITAAEVK
ncbi:MAG: aspartate-semialdehyde dehydrogenase, partial [Planctomycetota bacterium]